MTVTAPPHISVVIVCTLRFYKFVLSLSCRSIEMPLVTKLMKMQADRVRCGSGESVLEIQFCTIQQRLFFSRLLSLVPGFMQRRLAAEVRPSGRPIAVRVPRTPSFA